MRTTWTITVAALLVLFAGEEATGHGGGPYRGPGSEAPPPPDPPPPPPPPGHPRRYQGPTWEEWRRLVVEPRGRATQPERLPEAVRELREVLDGNPPEELARAIRYALDRHEPPVRASDDRGQRALTPPPRPIPPRRVAAALGSRFQSAARRCVMLHTLLVASEGLDPAAEDQAIGRPSRPAILLLLARDARGLDPQSERRIEILRRLRRAARASDPAVRKVVLLEVARLGREAAPDERRSIREQLRFHAEGGPFVTRPFAAHALRELIAPAPVPIVDAGRLVAIVQDPDHKLAARIDAARRLGRLGPDADSWRDRWVLPWLAGIRSEEIDRRVAEW